MLVKSFNGSYISIEVSDDDVREFNRTWPCSNVPAVSIVFEFAMRNRDLVGIDSNPDSSTFDGSALLALSHDAQEFAFPELKLERDMVLCIFGKHCIARTP